MQENNTTTVSVTLKTVFGKYLTVEALPRETLSDVVSRVQKTCGSSIALENLNLFGKNVDSSETILQLFNKANKNNPSPKISNTTLCRLCALGSKHLMDIFTIDKDYSEMIRTCLSIEVNANDKLPIKICRTCLEILTEFYKFKHKTTEAELKLKSYFKYSDNLTSSFRNASVMLNSNELFQTSEVDYLEEDFNTFNEASDNLFGSSENNLRSDMIEDDMEFSEDENKLLPCKWCSKSFDTIEDLYKHSLSHNIHAIPGKIIMTRKPMIRMAAPPKIRTRTERQQTCFLCTICDQVFPVKEFLVEHCDALHRTLETNLLTGCLVKLSRVFSCHMCDAKYLRVKQLRQHIQKCTISSSTRSSEIKNERKKLWCIPSIMVVRHVCKHCNKSFGSLNHLQKHQRGTDVEVSEKNFVCEDCNKSFFTQCGLKWHLKSHNETKTFICETCGETYNKMAYLQKHRKKHSVETPFPCDTCSRAFKTKEALKIHQRLHTGERPYSCKLCDKKFRTAGQISQHRKIHLDVKPFSCPVCPSSFRKSSQRTVHMLIHTGQRPYKCDYCEATFRYRVYMKTHMQNCQARPNTNLISE